MPANSQRYISKVLLNEALAKKINKISTVHGKR